MALRLEDMLQEYPAVTAENLQTLISAKKEFSDLATPADFNPGSYSNPEGYFPHQRLFMRLAQVYTELLYMADTGTGKTRSLIALMEAYRKQHGHIKHVYFFTGKTQIADFKRQLICDPQTTYKSALVGARTEKAQKRAITDAIKPIYTVTTYTSFINKYFPTRASKSKSGKSRVTPLNSNAEIIAKFSGCMFFLDEVQKIKIEPDNFKNLTNILSDEFDNTKKSTIKLRARFHNYVQFWRILHLAERSIKIIASARPVVNKLIEFAFHMNLILPLDRQMYHPLMKEVSRLAGVPILRMEKVRLSEATVESLRPYLQGRVIYFRAFKTGAVPEYPKARTYTMPAAKGVYTTELRLKYVRMSKFQKTAYYIARGRAPDTDKNIFELSKSGDSKPSSWYKDERRSANFVFPPKLAELKRGVQIGTWGSASFKDFVTFTKDGDKIRARDSLHDWLSTKGRLHLMSAKAYHITKKAIEEFGKRYVYTSFVAHGGVMMFGLALQYGHPDHPGREDEKFEQFNSRESVFVTVRGRVRDFCASTKVKTTIKPEFPKKLRYAIISGKNTAAHATIFELFNSKANVLGEYIKVIIVSPVGQVGINLSDCLHEDIIEPDFSPSTQYQSDKRIFRATSHVNIIKWLKQASFDLSIGSAKVGPDVLKWMEDTNFNPEVNKVKVHVNYWAAYDGEHKTDPLVDEIIYQYAQHKDVEIGRLARVCEELDLAAQINYEHNYRPDGIDGTAECNYLDCEYQPADPWAEPGSDTSTFDIYYIEPLLDDIINNIIRKHFRRQSVAEIGELLVQNPRISHEKYFLLAFEKMIRLQISVFDRLGYLCYVRTDNGLFYLSRNPPRNEDHSDYMSSYYDANLISVRAESLSSINLELHIDQLPYIWYRMQLEVAQSDEFRRLVDNLDPEEKLDLLADSLHKVSNDPDLRAQDPFINGIYYHFQDFISQNYRMLERRGFDVSQSSNVESTWSLLHATMGPSNTFQQIINKLSNASQTAVLEDTISRILADRELRQDPYIHAITVRFAKSYARMNKPVDAIRQAAFEAQRAKGRRGGSVMGTVTLPRGPIDPDQPIVYFHRLYNPSIQVARYGAGAKFSKIEGSIRVLEIGTPDARWRDALSYEIEVYKRYFARQLEEERQEFRSLDIYGTIQDNKLKVIDRRDPKLKTGGDKKIPGRVCDTFGEVQIIEQMRHLGIPHPKIINRKTREQYIAELNKKQHGVITIDMVPTDVKELDLETLEYFYTFLTTTTAGPGNKSGRRSKKNPLCVKLFKYLISKNMVETPDSGIPAIEQFEAIINKDKEAEVSRDDNSDLMS